MKTLFNKLLLFMAILVFCATHVNASCSASFSKSVSGLTVTFTNTSTTTSGFPNMMFFYWNFGDGTFSTQKNPVKTYTSGGLKVVQLIINDSFGCSKTITDTLLLASTTPTCNASFTKTISGLSVSFNNTSTTSGSSPSAVSYIWSFSDGTYSSLKHPTKTFSTPGIKVAQLTLYDSSTACYAAYSDTFMVVGTGSSCAALFTQSISGLTVTFNNISTNTNGTSAGLFYGWDFHDGTFSSAKNPVKTFATGGLKIVELTISDTLTGCMSTRTDTFSLTATGSLCNASFTRTISGLTVTFNNTSTNTNGTPAGLHYSWNFFDGTFSGAQNPVKTFATGGMKTVQLTISDTLNGCVSSMTDTFLLAPSGSSCQASFNTTISGLTVAFSNTSTNGNGTSAGLSYFWDFGDGTTSTLENPVKTFASGGPQYVQLSIFDSALSCSSTDSQIVNLSPLCSASFSLAIDTTTPFQFFLLNTSIIRPTSTFFWSFGDGGTSTSKTPTHTYASFGAYIVCLTVSDSVCTSTYCDTIGMDSTGQLLKGGAFGFRTIDKTRLTTGAGTGEVFVTPEYTIFPNPAASDVHISYTLKAAAPLTFTVTDITGKVLYTETVHAASGQHTETLNMDDFKPSIYFLNITSPAGHKNYKLIKN